MKAFLTLKAPQETRDYYFSQFNQLNPETEIIETRASLDRIVAEDLYAPESLPFFNRSTVDGYALRSSDSFGASESLPAFFKVVGEIKMGRLSNDQIQRGEAVVIHTGGMVPEGADAVVMIENTQITVPGEIEVSRAVAQNENVVLAGEDVKAKSLILTRGQRIRPGDIGALMSLGIVQLSVFVKPRVGIISSGDEVADPHLPIQPGQIRDINSYTLAALVQKYGGIPTNYGIAPDDYDVFANLAEKAFLENDMVIITAGSSASVRDLTAEIIQRLGSPGVLVHGVNVRPGKPTILAICSGKPVIGLPGNPVSAFVIANIFVVPILKRLSGLTGEDWEQKVSGILSVNISSSSGREDWVPVKLTKTNLGNQVAIEPIFYKSNLIFSIIKADGFVRIAPDVTGLSAGSVVDAIIF